MLFVAPATGGVSVSAGGVDVPASAAFTAVGFEEAFNGLPQISSFPVLL